MPVYRVQHGDVVVDCRTAKLWRAIEDEFGEPIRDLIVGFRADGYTWATIAGILGLGEQGRNVIVRWRKLLGLYDGRSTPVRYSDGPTPTDRKAQALGYKDASEAVYDLRVNKGMTYIEIQRVMGVSETALTKHSREATAVMPIVPKRREAMRQRGMELGRRKAPQDHIWRRD